MTLSTTNAGVPLLTTLTANHAEVLVAAPADVVLSLLNGNHPGALTAAVDGVVLSAMNPNHTETLLDA